MTPGTPTPINYFKTNLAYELSPIPRKVNSYQISLKFILPIFAFEDDTVTLWPLNILIIIDFTWAKVDWDFRISDLVKNPDGTDV